MSHGALIFADRLMKPLYATLKWSKAILPKKTKQTNHFYIIKFFGLGSITRIAYVIENSTVDKNNVTFITFKSNAQSIAFLGLNAVYIRSKNPFYFVLDSFKVFFHIWRKKETKVLDMERSSNFSGIFRVLLAIRKPSTGFSFDAQNRIIGNQTFISLQNKSAVQGILEMFELSDLVNNQSINTNEKTNQIIINVNAGTYLPERMFPLSKFADLVLRLHQKIPETQFLLTGAASETERVNAFQQLLYKNGMASKYIQNLAGAHNLEELSICIQNSDLLITNDSGPIHLANYLGAKAVAIWGPTAAELVGYRDSASMLNLIPTDTCSPCFLNPKSKVAKSCGGKITCFHNRDLDEMSSKIYDFMACSSKKVNIEE